MLGDRDIDVEIRKDRELRTELMRQLGTPGREWNSETLVGWMRAYTSVVEVAISRIEIENKRLHRECEGLRIVAERGLSALQSTNDVVREIATPASKL